MSALAVVVVPAVHHVLVVQAVRVVVDAQVLVNHAPVLVQVHVQASVKEGVQLIAHLVVAVIVSRLA